MQSINLHKNTATIEMFNNDLMSSTSFGGGGGTPVGSDSETKAFMQMLTLDAAKRLNYNREVESKGK